jgi:hypothetical protein
MRLIFAAALLSLLAGEDAHATCSKDRGRNNDGYQIIENTCSVHIEIKWIDEGDCRTGCQEGIGPGQTVLVPGMRGWTKIVECKGRYCHPNLN